MSERGGRRGRDRARACVLRCLFAGVAWPHCAAAFDTGVQVGETPVTVAVTESSSLLYNGNNRNGRDGDVASEIDDNWGLWSNRLFLQNNTGPLKLSVRVDSALFLTSKSPTQVALDLTNRLRDAQGRTAYNDADAEYFLAKYQQAGADLSSRFVSWSYPAKYQVSYETRAAKLVVGDFTAQFGRGLVLSVRKSDELQSDTSIRGARLDGELKTAEVTLGATVLAGTLNPLRIDTTSGRVLSVTPAVTGGLARVTEFGMPTAIDTDFAPEPRANFAPDGLVGAQVSARRGGRGLALSAVRLSRPCVQGPTGCETLGSDLVRSARTIDIASVAADLPDLAHAGDLYAEWAVQRLGDQPRGAEPRAGHALYVAFNTLTGPVAWTFEGKHYRSFFPLRASVDLGRAREFSPLSYTTPPTTEAVWNDTEFEGFNTCVTGGRAKADLRLSRTASLFTWLSHYATWAESGAAGRCDIVADSRNNVWDAAQGGEVSADGGRSHAQLSFGTRFDSASRPLVDESGQTTDVFYRELYTRFDAVKALTGALSLQLIGFHRRRRQTLGGPSAPWFQGQTSLALHVGQSLSVGGGFDYDENPAFPDTYVHGQVRYNLSPNDNVSLFVGQRQGGLRCVSGICRVFPPFAGTQLDATFRF